MPKKPPSDPSKEVIIVPKKKANTSGNSVLMGKDEQELMNYSNAVPTKLILPWLYQVVLARLFSRVLLPLGKVLFTGRLTPYSIGVVLVGGLLMLIFRDTKPVQWVSQRLFS